MKSDAMSVPEQVAPHREKRSLNPWLLVFGAGFGFMVLVIVGLSLLALLAPKQSLRANEFVMSDGKVLRIEAVTWGKQHRLNFDYSSSASWEFWNRRTMPVQYGMGHDQLMVWMTCRDARSGRSLDFDWWSGSLVVDSLGEELRDSNPMFWQFGPRGSSGGGGQRPFRADRSGYDTWLVGSAFPAFRTDQGHFKLQVKNLAGEVIGNIELTHPSPPVAQTWQAEELPATKSVGNVAVTMNRLNANSQSHSHNGVEQKWWYYWPDASVSENGQPTNEWSVNQLNVTDPLGNQPQYGQSLSIREPAWKVRVVAVRNQTSKFTAAETWNPADLALPAKDTAVPLADSKTIDGVTVTFLSLAGPGKTSYSIATPGLAKYGNFTYSGGGAAFGSSTKVESRRNGSTATRTVEANWPHLTLETTSLSPLHRVYVLAKDDQGRAVETQQSHDYGELQSCFFKTEPDAKSLTLSVIVHKGHEFEFFVKPPELPDDKPKP